MPKTQNKTKIASLLSDGEFHSGEALGKVLGISRAAVANHVKSLSELGLDIYSVTGRGYKLSSEIELLDKDKINNSLTIPVSLETYSIIDSTNEYLMKKIREDYELVDGHTVVAECQTDGRGRRGRKWQSPFGSHVYLSQYRTLEDGLTAASGLSLAVGIAVQRAITTLVDAQIQLKWPNDVLCEGKKLAGILIEAEGQSEGKCHLIIGIGINFDMPEKEGLEIDQAWVDIKSLTHKKLDRNKFIATLIEALDTIMIEYSHNRLDNLVDEWNRLDAFHNIEVKVMSNSNVKTGVCRGIDNTGALILEHHESTKRERVFGGEVSLRRSE